MYDISSRHSELARAIFALVGSEAFGLEEGLRAVVALEVDRPEWAVLKAESHWLTINNSQAAVVGARSSVGIINRENSGVLVIVQGLVNTGANSAQIKKGVLPDAVFEAQINVEAPISEHMDTRLWRSPGNAGANAARTFTADAIGSLAGVPHGGWDATSAGQSARTGVPPCLAVLKPGSWVALENAQADNLAQSAFFWGYSKPLAQRDRA